MGRHLKKANRLLRPLCWAVCAGLLSGGPAGASDGMPPDIANTAITLRGMIAPEGSEAVETLHEPGSVEFHASAVPVLYRPLRTTRTGRDLIKSQEGLRLTAYRGPSGMWLIGYGHAGTAKKGMKITRAEAERLFRRDLREHEDNIDRVVKVPVTPNEFSAMVSLSYTIGIGAFAKSSVVKHLNAGDREKAADAFLLFNKITRNGERKANTYLTQRRLEERALFVKPWPDEPRPEPITLSANTS